MSPTPPNIKMNFEFLILNTKFYFTIRNDFFTWNSRLFQFLLREKLFSIILFGQFLYMCLRLPGNQLFYFFLLNNVIKESCKNCFYFFSFCIFAGKTRSLTFLCFINILLFFFFGGKDVGYFQPPSSMKCFLTSASQG